MKLDEANIADVTNKLIDEICGNIYEYCDTEEGDRMRIATLGEISGVIKLSERLIEVTKL